MADASPPSSARDRPLAAALFLAWRAADAPLQAAIEHAIRTHAQRSPTFLPYLRFVPAYYAALSWLPARSPRWLAVNLYAVWYAADPPLRTDLEAVIRTYVVHQPAFMHDLHEVIALQQRIAATGWP